MSALSIRPLTEELVETMADAKPGWASASPTWLESMRAGRSTLLVAVDGEDPVGVAQLVHSEVPEVCNVGVLEQHRGRGIGAAPSPLRPVGPFHPLQHGRTLKSTASSGSPASQPCGRCDHRAGRPVGAPARSRRTEEQTCSSTAPSTHP